MGAALIVGSLLIVVAATGGLPERNRTSLAFDPASLGEAVLPVIRVAYLAVLLAAFYHLLVGREKTKGRRRRRSVSPVATLLALTLLAVTTFFLLGLGDDLAPNILFPQGDGAGSGQDAIGDEAADDGSGSGLPEGAGEEAGSQIEALLDNPLFLLALVGAAAVAIAVLLRPAGDEDEEVPAVPPAGVPGHKADQAEDDAFAVGAQSPRQRIFAAYSGVEAASVRHQVERGQAETVSRHLRRLPIASTSAARRLADLYNQARFSPYPIDDHLANDAERLGTTVTGELS